MRQKGCSPRKRWEERTKRRTHVGSELEVRDSSLDDLGLGLVEMTVDDLLGESQRSVESTSHKTKENRRERREIGIERDVIGWRNLSSRQGDGTRRTVLARYRGCPRFADS
jgi:hypothetical protein